MTNAADGKPNQGLVTNLLRLEGAAALGAGIALYQQTGADWIWFIVLLALPDVSTLGYARGPAVGAVIYDLVHTPGPSWGRSSASGSS